MFNIILQGFGLCNRLRVLFSYYYYIVKEKKDKLNIVWIVDEQCNGFFLDYFEPLPNVEFYRDNSNNFPNNYKGKKGVTAEPHPKYALTKFNGIFKELIPKPYLMDKINHNLKLLDNNFVAMHIRHTDNIRNTINKNININTPFLKKHFDFFDKYIKLNFNIYLATDNKNIQDIFYDKYPNNFKTNKNINEVTGLRHSTLENAIIDIFTCSYSKDFIYNHSRSSFRETICELIKYHS